MFYGNLKHPSGSVEHMGDNRTGAGEGDDEQIRIDLSRVPENLTKIAFTATIYEPEQRTSQPNPTTTFFNPGFPFVRFTF